MRRLALKLDSRAESLIVRLSLTEYHQNGSLYTKDYFLGMHNDFTGTISPYDACKPF